MEEGISRNRSHADAGERSSGTEMLEGIIHRITRERRMGQREVEWRVERKLRIVVEGCRERRCRVQGGMVVGW